MERKEFLRTAAIGSIAVCLGCLSACKKEDAPQNPDPLPTGGLEVDLSKPENSALNTVGGSLTKQGILIAQNKTDEFVALAVNCTHEGTPVTYVHSAQRLHCPNHGSEFSLSGAVLIGPANKALKKYTVTKNGTVLKIT